MRNYVLIFCAVAVFFLLVSCTIQEEQTDMEMYESANEVYRDYLFEYGIDSTLFSSPTIESRENGRKSYKWIAFGTEDEPVGVEVIVANKKGAKPEMILIGNTEAWFPFVGSKRRP